MVGILECAFEEMLALEKGWRKHGGIYRSLLSIVWHDDILILPREGDACFNSVFIAACPIPLGSDCPR